MGILRSKSKAKSSAKSKAKVKGSGGAKSSAAASRTKRAAKVGGVIAKGVISRFTGVDVGEVIGAAKQSNLPVSMGGNRSGKRRRGVIPKRVRKWLGKTVRRRKAEERAMRKMLKIKGASRVVRQSRYSDYGSPGVITRSEALRDLKR